MGKGGGGGGMGGSDERRRKVREKDGTVNCSGYGYR